MGDDAPGRDDSVSDGSTDSSPLGGSTAATAIGADRSQMYANMLGKKSKRMSVAAAQESQQEQVAQQQQQPQQTQPIVDAEAYQDQLQQEADRLVSTHCVFASAIPM